MKRRTMALFMTACMTMGMLAGCGGGGTDSTTASGTDAQGGDQTEAEETGDKGPIYDDYSEKTDEELYELALEEAKTSPEINIYATSSKMLKNEEAFEEAFPGLDVVITDMDNDEVIEKCKTENETGNITGDVLQVKDSNGNIFYEMVEDGYVTRYYPKDICENIDPEFLEYGYPLYSSQSFWYYNTDAFPDGQPVNNWWEIIEMNEDGTQKYRLFTKEIGQESTYLALFASFIQNADQMEQAYKDLYGTDLEYTYDASKFEFDVPENNAGVEYLWRFSQMKMTFIGDGDELVLAVDQSTADDPALALASGGKIGNRDDSGYAIAWLTNLAPYTGITNTEYLYVVSGSDNEAGARLFIRWCTGGADGESGGLKPFSKEGNWPARNDIEVDWNGDYATVEECGAIAPDIAGIYKLYYDVQDMWIYWLNQNPNMK